MTSFPPAGLRLVLLDRDGVLNEDRDDYVKSVAELRVIPGAGAAVARLNRAGLRVVVVTNQSAVGRGIITADGLDAIHAALGDRLAADGGTWDAVLVAPDHPDRATDRRKPGPGMLLEAMQRFGIPPDATIFVGDQPTDAEAARRAGVAFLLVRTGKGARTEARLPAAAAATVCDDLSAAVAVLLGPVP